jgi:hypothetical protein
MLHTQIRIPKCMERPGVQRRAQFPDMVAGILISVDVPSPGVRIAGIQHGWAGRAEL